MAHIRSIVTSAAGFIGSHLATHLIAQGHEVVGIDPSLCLTDAPATLVTHLSVMSPRGKEQT